MTGVTRRRAGLGADVTKSSCCDGRTANDNVDASPLNDTIKEQEEKKSTPTCVHRGRIDIGATARKN